MSTRLSSKQRRLDRRLIHRLDQRCQVDSLRRRLCLIAAASPLPKEHLLKSRQT